MLNVSFCLSHSTKSTYPGVDTIIEVVASFKFFCHCRSMVNATICLYVSIHGLQASPAVFELLPCTSAGSKHTKWSLFWVYFLDSQLLCCLFLLYVLFENNENLSKKIFLNDLNALYELIIMSYMYVIATYLLSLPKQCVDVFLF